MGNTSPKRPREKQYSTGLGPANKDLEWSYTREKGPSTWWVYYPLAAGIHQSPIDINPAEVEIDSDLSANLLTFAYNDHCAYRLINTGHSAQVDFSPGCAITGGPLEHIYRLAQFHFHWGMTCSCGSEHLVNGKAFAGEIHLVHWNAGLYSSFEEAKGSKDGLAVLATFLEMGTGYNEGIHSVIQKLHKIQYKNNFVPIQAHPRYFIPADRSKYWAYEGSLTTPPCTENVTWIVFEDPIKIHSDQLAEFRKLKTYTHNEHQPSDEFEGHQLQNFRPVHRKGHRKIYSVKHKIKSDKDFEIHRGDSIHHYRRTSSQDQANR